MRRLTWNVPKCTNIMRLLTAVLNQGLLCFGSNVPEHIVNKSVRYITQKDIVADCGITRVDKYIELSDWVIGEAHRLHMINGPENDDDLKLIVGNHATLRHYGT